MSISPAEVDYFLKASRGWLGLTRAGRVELSLEHALANDPAGARAHEQVHNILVKMTPFGAVQQLLSALTHPPFPASGQERARELLALTVKFSFEVHEGTASFWPSLEVAADAVSDYWNKLPGSYVAASQVLSWLMTSGLPKQRKAWCAVLAARRALEIPIVDDWRAHRLYEPENLNAYLGASSHSPSSRLRVIVDFLSGLSDAELLAWMRTGVSEPDRPEIEWRFETPPGPESIPFTPHAPDPAFNSSVVEQVLASWLDDPMLAQPDRDVLEGAKEAPGLAFTPHPTHLSTTIVETRADAGKVFDEPDPTELLTFELCELLYNPFDAEMPGIEFVSGRRLPLQPDQAAMWLYGDDGRKAAARISARGLAEYLRCRPPTATLCINDSCYEYGETDIFFRDLVRSIPHVVLVRQPPQQLLLMLSTFGFAGAHEAAFYAGKLDASARLGYFFLRPAARPFPTLLFPVLDSDAARTQEAIGQVLALERVDDPRVFFGLRDQLRDVGRVIRSFEGQTKQS